MRNLNGIAASTRSAALLGFILSPFENGGILALVMTRPSLSLSLSLDPFGDVAFFFVFSPRELRPGGERSRFRLPLCSRIVSLIQWRRSWDTESSRSASYSVRSVRRSFGKPRIRRRRSVLSLVCETADEHRDVQAMCQRVVLGT